MSPYAEKIGGTAPAGDQPRLFVLLSYAAGVDVNELGRRYMASPEFAEDIKGFDVANIVHVS